MKILKHLKRWIELYASPVTLIAIFAGVWFISLFQRPVFDLGVIIDYLIKLIPAALTLIATTVTQHVTQGWTSENNNKFRYECLDTLYTIFLLAFWGYLFFS